MKKLLALSLVLVLAFVVLVGPSIAAKVGTFGIPVSDVAPLEVDSAGALTITADLTMTGDLALTGDLTPTGALTVTGEIYTDGTLYDAEILSDGAITPGVATLDPCGTLAAGAIFIHTTTKAPCFCNSLGVDLSLYDGTSACF